MDHGNGPRNATGRRRFAGSEAIPKVVPPKPHLMEHYLCIVMYEVKLFSPVFGLRYPLKPTGRAVGASPVAARGSARGAGWGRLG